MGSQSIFSGVFLFLLLGSSHPALALHPTWAGKAVGISNRCTLESGYTGVSETTRGNADQTPPAGACRALRILSPDEKNTIFVRYRKAAWDKNERTYEAYLEIKSQDGNLRIADLPAGDQTIDLLWSPDSRAFFVNGGNGGGYWGFWVYVYRLDDPELKPIDVAARAQRDMVTSFPPCKANWLDQKTCRKIEQNPDYNMSGIDWVGDSSKLVVMAEVPCSGGHGGIMCQVMGYELEASTGRILQRMNAREFGHQWQKSMAWKFIVPSPPVYCDPATPAAVDGCTGHTW